MSIIVLNSTTKSIEALLEGAVAANQPEFSAHYADVTATAFTEGENDGVLNNTTAVSLVAAPAASTRRIVKEIVIYNADTAAVTVTIRINNNSNYRRIQKVTLPAGETWKLSDGAASSSSSYDLAGDIHGATNKTTPVDADEVGIRDSVSGLLNRLSWANIKAGIISRILASVSDGQYLLRSGTDIIGGTPAGGGGGAVDWIAVVDSWTYASAQTITVPSGAAAIYSVGDRLRLKQGGAYKYYYIVGVADTLLTVTGGSDYTVATPTAITDIYYSKNIAPLGFPKSFSLGAPTWTSAGTPFTNQPPTNTYKITINGGACIVSGKSVMHATSGATSGFIATFPTGQIPNALVDGYGVSYNNATGYAGSANIFAGEHAVRVATYDFSTWATNSQNAGFTIQYLF